MSESSIRNRIPYIKLPPYVKKALKMFEDNGFEAYVVGGAVRDLLREAESVNDYDITTNALPEQTKSVFSGYMIYETGIKHGTVTVNLDGNTLEITTFRTDGEYTDSRHPDKVTFTRNIVEDLARRDFTVNAMALSIDGMLVDPFGGVVDLANGVICAVGEPEKRFTEDALRIMRAFRFAAKLCYTIDEETLLATQKCAKGLQNISRERIGVEWEKLITSPFCARSLCYMKKYGIFDVIFPEVETDLKSLSRIEALPNKYTLRCAAFFKNIPAEKLSSAAYSICLKNSDRDGIELILRAYSELIANRKLDLRLFAYQYGIAAYDSSLIAFSEGAVDHHYPSHVKMSLQTLTITTRTDLDVTGDDIINAGIADRSLISPIYSIIISKVVCGTLKNEKTAILNELPQILAEIESDRLFDSVGWRKMKKYSIK